jgi:hypothetical protein
MDPTTNQDLYTLRAFVGGLNAALNDQSYAGADAVAYNPVGQFYSTGPYGVAVEGTTQPVAVSGGVSMSPNTLLLLAIGVGVWLLSKKG